jgi:hypothetical protein
MSNPTLHHVNLKTTRLKEMIDWYGAVVGLKPLLTTASAAGTPPNCELHGVCIAPSSGIPGL